MISVKIQYPLKQGLKREERRKYDASTGVKIQYPLKQGLKLFPRIEAEYVCESKFNIH